MISVHFYNVFLLVDGIEQGTSLNFDLLISVKLWETLQVFTTRAKMEDSLGLDRWLLFMRSLEPVDMIS
jgi:hypothetical protein